MSVAAFSTTRLLPSMKRFSASSFQFGMQTPEWSEGGDIEQGFYLNQIHSAKVYTYRNDRSAPTPPIADAVITKASSVSLCIRTADCLPILFRDRRGEWIGAAHGGWRGLHQGIVASTLEHLRDEGVNPNDLHVYIGPSIRKCCYRVSDEMRTSFDEKYFSGRGESLKLDLHRIAVNQLLEGAVHPDSIVDSAICSQCHAGIPSVRREGADCARMVSWIKRR